jgi:REP element-mobilizing transposase RayT
MSRPLRIEFPGAVYHVTSRGDRREPIYRDDHDRMAQLDVIAQAMDRFDAQVLAYCLMGNHYHLVLHTRQANLSRLMRHVNGVYTQAFNRRHGLVGHLLQGRFKANLVDRDAYLLALCRYVERNPVAAGLVRQPQDWSWSSCRAHLGLEGTPPWLDSDGLHGYLLARSPQTHGDRRRAARIYTRLVTAADAGDEAFWHTHLRQQIFLGDEAFAQRMQARAEPARRSARDVPRPQRQPVADTPAARERLWKQCLNECQHDRAAALLRAYRGHGMTMTALAPLAGLSVSRVSRLIAGAERATAGAGITAAARRKAVL